MFNKSNCNPEWDCGEWDECRAVYDLEEIVENKVLLKGERKRFCKDRKGCLFEGYEREECNPTVPVFAQKVNRCFEDFIEIYQNETLISRLQFINGSWQILNVQMLFGNEDVCPYCYDGIQNYDETGIDCGGNCGECGFEIPLKQYDIVKIIFIGVLVVLGFGLVYFILLKLKSGRKVKIIKNFLNKNKKIIRSKKKKKKRK